jgi:peroxiredoxin Q/BCP
MLKSGQKAPDVRAPIQDGSEVTLSGLLERGPLVLYFYPKDFTPG